VWQEVDFHGRYKRALVGRNLHDILHATTAPAGKVFHPAIVIVELGSNDPGRTPPEVWEGQLRTIIGRIEAHGSRVILGGLDEPGMGDIYRQLAVRYHVPLVWFIAKVATLPGDWSDAHHPNGVGYRVVMDSFWPAVASMARHS
jgi:lysophospholipase L1-like esterase